MKNDHLDDNLNIVPAPVYNFVEHEISVLLSRAQAIVGTEIWFRSPDNLSVLCHASKDGESFVVTLPRALISRTALIAALLNNTRQPSGKRVYWSTNQNTDSQQLQYLTTDQRDKYIERHRKDISDLPKEYSQLVGSFDAGITADGLIWWTKHFEIADGRFLHKRRDRERFRFAILFLFCHELMHVVLGHLDSSNGDPTSVEQVERRRRRFELEADIAALHVLISYSLATTMRYSQRFQFTSDDVRHYHLFYGEVSAVVEGMVFAAALLDCSRMWHSDYKYTYYYPPSSRVYLAAIAAESLLQEVGGQRFLLRTSIFEYLANASWWFRTTTLFNNKPEILDVNFGEGVGEALVRMAIIEFSSDASDFLWHNFHRHNLQAAIFPFNMSFSAELPPVLWEKMRSCLEGDAFLEKASKFADIEWFANPDHDISALTMRY